MSKLLNYSAYEICHDRELLALAKDEYSRIYGVRFCDSCGQMARVNQLLTRLSIMEMSNNKNFMKMNEKGKTYVLKNKRTILPYVNERGQSVFAVDDEGVIEFLEFQKKKGDNIYFKTLALFVELPSKCRETVEAVEADTDVDVDADVEVAKAQGKRKKAKK